MFGWDDILQRIREQPFRPVRIIASESRQFDIYHPDLVIVGHRDVMILHPGPDHPSVYDRVTRVALIHVVALEDLPAYPTKTGGAA